MIRSISNTHEILMSNGDYLKLGNKYYKYIGRVQNIASVPETDCLYTIDDGLFIRRIDFEKLQRIKTSAEPVKNIDTSDELDLEVKPGDDSTLIIVKELLKGITKNQFRKFFTNDSDMNNMRRQIEKSKNGKLSLDRFRYILNALGLQYKIIVYEKDDVEQTEEMRKKIEKIACGVSDDNCEIPNDEVEENDE